MTHSDWIDVGEVTAPHGVRGEVRVVPLVEFSPIWIDEQALSIVTRDGLTRTCRVERVRPHGKVLVVALADITSRDEADALRGARLVVPREALEPLPEGSYYLFELEGLSVCDERGAQLGVLTKVLQTGANDVYVVRAPDGKELLLPATRECVQSVDLAAKRMTVRLLPGLDEL